MKLDFRKKSFSQPVNSRQIDNVDGSMKTSKELQENHIWFGTALPNVLFVYRLLLRVISVLINR